MSRISGNTSNSRRIDTPPERAGASPRPSSDGARTQDDAARARLLASSQVQAFQGQSGFTIASVGAAAALSAVSGKGPQVNPSKVGVVLNDDPHNLPSAADLNALGVGGVRVTLNVDNWRPEDSDNLDAWKSKLTDYRANNIDVVLNLPSELASGFPPAPNGYHDGDPLPEGWEDQFNEYKNNGYLPRLNQVLDLLGDKADGFEIWNEPDEPDNREQYHPAIPSADFGQLLQDAYGAIHGNPNSENASVITGGVDSGQASYLSSAAAATGGQLYADAVGLHPYAKDPRAPEDAENSVQHIVGDYSGFTSPQGGAMPIYITEASSPDRADTDFIPSFARTADNLSNVARSYFFWKDTWDGHPGLMGPDGPTEAYKRLGQLLGTQE